MSELTAVSCDDCGETIAYMGSEPRGFMICSDCYEERDKCQHLDQRQGAEGPPWCADCRAEL